jgi:hypothetical protein
MDYCAGKESSRCRAMATQLVNHDAVEGTQEFVQGAGFLEECDGLKSLPVRVAHSRQRSGCLGGKRAARESGRRARRRKDSRPLAEAAPESSGRAPESTTRTTAAGHRAVERRLERVRARRERAADEEDGRLRDNLVPARWTLGRGAIRGGRGQAAFYAQ